MAYFYVTRMLSSVVLYSHLTIEADSYSAAVELAKNTDVDWNSPDEREDFGKDIVNCVSDIADGIIVESTDFGMAMDHCLSSFGSQVDQLAATQRAEQLASTTPKSKARSKKGSRL
jgi:hypothetical protein